MKALKKWDKFVFKKDIVDPNKASSSHNVSAAGREDGENTEKDNEKEAGNNDYDFDGRPKLKVILLCGPPGTGKVYYPYC